MALVEIETDGNVVVISLKRAEKHNALNRELLSELSSALSSEEVQASGCVVLAGAGKSFSAGADLKELNEGVDLRAELMGTVHDQLADLGVPSVSAITGYCLGGGLELALATDIRVAANDSKLGLPEIGLGTIPSWGGILRLVRLLGEARARHIVLLGEQLSAERAEQIGLVSEVVEPADVLPRAKAVADQLAKMPDTAMLVARGLLSAALESSFRAGALTQVLGADALSQRARSDASG